MRRVRSLSSAAVFQSTHPSGVRHLEGRRHSHPIDFNPRTPVGCDLSPPLIRRCRRYFNPRTPVGCDSLGLSELNSSETFQSTHPSGVRLMLRKRTQPTSNFNPRTPVGCDERGFHAVGHFGISIHAPQWGATATSWFTVSSAIDFNPRTPVGCDTSMVFGSWPTTIFQSTHPSGVRPGTINVPNGSYEISIHAPQWGATTRPTRSCTASFYFNPRTPVGCDGLQHGWPPGLVSISIHAPQWGATMRQIQRPLLGPDFNPRTPVGCDVRIPRFQGYAAISIHAPQWGATSSRLGIGR